MCLTLIIWSIFISSFCYCSDLVVHMQHITNLFLWNVIIEYCKSFHCLLICPLYLFHGSDLVYRENTKNGPYSEFCCCTVAVHFKSAELLVILTTSVLARSLMSQIEITDSLYPIVVSLCHSLYISIVRRNHPHLFKRVMDISYTTGQKF